MTAAAAGGKRLAPLRWGPRPLPQASFHSGKRARTARMASYLALFFSVTLVACAAIGFALAQRADETLAAEGHAALRAALEELRPSLADPDRPDAGELPLFERRAGLKDLQFDANPRAEPGREEQSLHDDEGRIVGWFSWKADRGFAAVMERLWMLVALVGVALAVFAGLAARAARKLTDALAGSLDTVRKLTGEDALTGLPNQRSMLEHLNVAVAGSTPGFLALALIDLDAFREVNDTLGRTGGDRVIANVAEHLQAGLPAGAQLGRFEDDEFAVFLRGDDPDTATRLVDALRTALLRPIFMERVWQITAGIGVVQAPEDGTTGEELARRAGLALSVAKREGRGAVRRFEPQIEVEYTDRHFLLRELESAISLQALDVHYQPIVAADGGAIVGVEALLRWTHATRGAIEPSVFIPLAEQSGLMSRLGEIVLRRALADGARWPRISVCVNLSPVQIRDRWLIELVSAVMAETGIAPSRVVLEVTEGILIDNPQEALARLEALRALGASIALDDFGTGYSSLSYLQKFPFERLKIDRTFVASLGTTANSGAIIQSIVTLGHALGMSVLAEGVETDEQRVLVRLAGCDEMQGFLFASPCPAAEIDRALAGVAVAVRPSTGPAAASVR